MWFPKDHSHMHLPLWISMHPKRQTPYKKGSTHRTKPFIEELREEWEKHKLNGELQKPSEWIFRNNLLLTYPEACMKQAIVFGELPKEGRWSGKKQFHHNVPGQSWGCCNVHRFHQTCLIPANHSTSLPPVPDIITLTKRTWQQGLPHASRCNRG